MFCDPTCVTAVGLKGTPRDVFLELGNGEKYLSKGYVPEVHVVTAGLAVKIGLNVSNLLHEVDLVLGINWFQLVNPVVTGAVHVYMYRMQSTPLYYRVTG